MITWAEKVAFVGMAVTNVTPDSPMRYNQYSVRLSHNPGSCSYGDGKTMEKAIENAAIGMNMCWSSVERKMTELEWQWIAHT